MTTKEFVEYKKIGFMSDIQTRVDEIRELRKELKKVKVISQLDKLHQISKRDNK